MTEPQENKCTPDPSDDCVDQALALARSDRLEDAIEVLKSSTDPSPSSPRYLGTLANMLSDAGRFEESLAILDRLAADFPADALVAANRAIVLRRIGESDAELLECRRAIELSPDNVHFAADYLEAVGRTSGQDSFLAEYDRLHTDFETDPTFLAMVGSAAGRLGLYELSSQLLDEAVRREPDNNKAWGDLSASLVGMEDYENAEEAASRALRINPTDHIALANLGYIAECRGEKQKAILYYQQVLEANPDYDRVRSDLARLTSRTRRHRKRR